MTRYLVHWLYNDCLHNFKKNLKNQAKSLYMYDQKWKTFPYHMLSYIRFFFFGGGDDSKFKMYMYKTKLYKIIFNWSELMTLRMVVAFKT